MKLKKALCIIFSLIIVVLAAGCAQDVGKTNDPIEPITNYNITTLTQNRAYERNQAALLPDNNSTFAKFSIDFWNEIIKSEKSNTNACVSPLSAFMAFSLCFSGADGQTLKEFENATGFTKQQASEYCSSIVSRYMQNEQLKSKLTIANSLWIDKKYEAFVQQDYLTNAIKYFYSPVFSGDFSSGDTVKALNKWVSDNTNNMIKELITEFNKEEFLAIVNTLFLESSWLKRFTPINGIFTDYTQAQKEANYLNNTHSVYYKSDNALAFSEPLMDDFSFVGILPNEGIDINDYLTSFDYAEYTALSSPIYGSKVITAIPEFSFDYSVDLKSVMKKMGMEAAFGEMADFTKMAVIPEKYVYIDRALQKTRIELDKNGVKAAAATYIGMGNKTTAMPENEPIVKIELTRPFVFMIVDNSLLPIFIGTVKTI